MFSKTVGNTLILQELQKYSITVHKSVKVKTLGVAHLDNKTSSLVNLTKNYLSTIDIIQHKKEFVSGLEAEVKAHKKGVV